MSFKLEILADSISPNGSRLTTFQLRYPRFIHQELLTHRLFSRNASSSRAIPIEKMIDWIEEDPAIPIHFGSRKKGMQAGEESSQEIRDESIKTWIQAKNNAIASARKLNELGIHKQVANRLLEPFSHMNVVLSATQFENFFALRCHKDAQPEIQYLAVLMANAYNENIPDPVPEGSWHLPYITPAERLEIPIKDLVKVSVARCCRVSYLTVDGKMSSVEKDIDLHDRLISDGHWSPLEHVAMSCKEKSWSGNFFGWIQYRKTLSFHEHQKFDYSCLDSFKRGFKIN